ncbi:MAG: energy transducer TonB [Flavobacteriales bacterium]
MKSPSILIAFFCLGNLSVGCQNSEAVGSIQQAETELADSKEKTAQLVNLGPILFAEDDFVFDIDARFQADLTKSKLKEMKLITDFDERINVDGILEVESTSVTIINDEYEDVKQAFGKSNELTDEQLQLIASAPYSTDIRLQMDYRENSPYFKKPQSNYTTPHITIIPEKSAEYEGGKDALIAHLKQKSEGEVARAQKAELKPGKVRFTVTKTGEVVNVILISSSGYESIDETMLKLLQTLPNHWKPAQDAAGNTVDEQLVFSYGIMGC